MASKRCTKCGVEKPIEDFHSRKDGSIGVRPWCKVCTNKDCRKYRPRGERKRAGHLRWRYGISLEDYERLLQTQDGKCAICGTTSPGRKGVVHFAVDHDHESNTVRGLLCASCNQGLGRMNDDPERLEAAARYLRAFKNGGAGSPILSSEWERLSYGE